MGFVRTPQEIAAQPCLNGVYYGSEVLVVYFETRRDIVERLLPAPLRPAKLPICATVLSTYPRTNLGISYRESALLLPAEFEGEEGAYCLSMPVTDDMALILGRERYGYPKKMADIELNREGKCVRGWTERHATRFFEVEANLTGQFNDQTLQQVLTQRVASRQVATQQLFFNFKHFPASDAYIDDARRFDYNPRLVRIAIEMKPKSVEIGTANLTFRPSKHDPWSEVEIVRTLGAVYSVGDHTLLPGRIVAEADAATFAPYAFMKRDVFEPER